MPETGQIQSLFFLIPRGVDLGCRNFLCRRQDFDTQTRLWVGSKGGRDAAFTKNSKQSFTGFLSEQIVFCPRNMKNANLLSFIHTELVSV